MQSAWPTIALSVSSEQSADMRFTCNHQGRARRRMWISTDDVLAAFAPMATLAIEKLLAADQRDRHLWSARGER